MDFINIGLTAWEAEVLFSELRRRGEHKLLFACLIARAQYREAFDLLTEVDSDVLARLSRGRENHKFSSATSSPLIRALVTTMLSCLPSLKYLRPFSRLVVADPQPSQWRCGDANSNNKPETPVAARVKLDAVNANTSGGRLPRQLATPRGPRLGVQPPTTVDRNRASEFWNYFDMRVPFAFLPRKPEKRGGFLLNNVCLLQDSARASW